MAEVKFSSALMNVENIAENKKILKNLKCLNNFCHAVGLGEYHSMFSRYCPRKHHFTLNGVIARNQLAVLDENCSSKNVQTITKDGKFVLRVNQNW